MIRQLKKCFLSGSKMSLNKIFARRKLSGFLVASALMLASFVMVVPSSAAAVKSDIGDINVSVFGEEFMINTPKGKKIKLITTQKSDAGDIHVGYSKDTGPFYVRTLNHYTGEKEKPLFDINNPTAGEDPEVIAEGNLQPEHSEEFLPLSTLSQVDAASLKLGTVIAAGANTITLAWNKPEGTEEVTVLLNDKQIVNAGDGVQLKGLSADKTYDLTVNFSKLNGGTRETVREDLHVIQTLAIGLGNPYKSAKNVSEITTFATYNKVKALRLVTFLKNDFYSTGWAGAVGCGTPIDWYFKGDNRGYSTPSGPTPVYVHASHRTGFEFVTNLDGPVTQQGVFSNKSVGFTSRYNAAKNYMDRAIPDASGMVMQNLTVSGNYYVKFGVSHEVGNPYCLVGKIRYALPLVEMYKTGTVSISGSRQPMPTFEFYASFAQCGSGVFHWVNMYRGAKVDFSCLVGLCAAQNISKTHGVP